MDVGYFHLPKSGYEMDVGHFHLPESGYEELLPCDNERESGRNVYYGPKML